MNQTTVVSFFLLGFQNNQLVNTMFFIIILWIYILTLVGNFLLIILVVTVPALRSPMYVLLSQLSLSDILLTTNITPDLLRFLLSGGGKIYLSDCLTQFFFYCVSTSIECFLLTVMSYDRFLAICNPLRYGSIMGFKFCLSMNVIFCMAFALFPVCFIIFTYISIGLAILRITSTNGRHKAFSTCSSHLIVVCTYYGTLVTVYMVPSKGPKVNMNKMLSLIYIVGTPFFNPIVYSLRNNEIKITLQKCMQNLLVIHFYSVKSHKHPF
ncbi:hypothetical protein XELAEV_18019461mg [Xenopus laevis]|uniref:G-protein coupled receptors family 1 profile domain-containing protein n=1 Tax=Xenopus laevis TaxID=8355 RepID=A0A974HUJ7_XENLA|nr:hypothetical protein XELAEV_18019461mg [Xenopus laevis]